MQCPGPRSRNCYKLATQYNLAALRVARELRWARKDDARSLWDSRLEGVRTYIALYPHLSISTLYHVKVANTLNYDAWHIREALNR